MKTAIVYDRVNKWGGAERVLLVLNKMFPEAPLYTSLYDPETAEWARVFPKVVPSFLQKVKLLRRRHEMLAGLMPLAFESHDFSGYDLVFSVTSEAAKGIITKPGTRHVCYCLTPTRYLWSGYEEYFDDGLKRMAIKPIIGYLRRWDKLAAQRPDVMIAISNEVRERIMKYYSRESKLIYPPVDLTLKNSLLRVSSTTSRSLFEESDLGYYLVVSRLVKYKKVDLVVEAFNEMRKNLLIVGEGVEENKLKGMAKKNIGFVKGLTDGELANCYKNCTALVAAQREDFGLAMVEAMQHGKPVIAFRGGGALEIIEEGKTGLFFELQDRERIIEAVRKFERLTFDPGYIENSVVRFSENRFKKEMSELINKFVKGNIIS